MFNILPSVFSEQMIHRLSSPVQDFFEDLLDTVTDSFTSSLWDLISHPIAMAVYVVLLLFLVIVLIATVLVGENRFAKLPEDTTKAAAEALAKEIDDGLLKANQAAATAAQEEVAPAENEVDDAPRPPLLYAQRA